MSRRTQERPTGQIQGTCAIFCAGLAVILLVFALLLPTERYDEIIARNIAVRYWLCVAGFGLLQAALLCALTAVLLRALCFLPGGPSDPVPVETDQMAVPTLGGGAAASAAAPSTHDLEKWALIIGVLPLIALLAFIAYVALAHG